MWGAYWILAVAMAVVSVRGKGKNGFQLLLPLLFFVLHISYGAGTCIGLIKMPFWRRAHRSCPSVERVRKYLEEKDERTTA